MIMADYIYTASKKKFYPLSPGPEDIDIADIAHALSMLARANGHFPSFHSVAQHCIECATEAMERGYSPRVCLGCLLHDGSEAYMSDVTTPVKNHLENYRSYEENLSDMIYNKYIGKLTDEEKQLIYKVDKDLLYYEFLHYMGIELSDRPSLLSKPVFEFVPFENVKKAYIALFEKLVKNQAEPVSES